MAEMTEERLAELREHARTPKGGSLSTQEAIWRNRLSETIRDNDRLTAENERYQDATHCPWCGLRLRELFHDGFCNRPPMWKGFNNPEPTS